MKCLCCGKEYNPVETGQICPVCDLFAYRVIGDGDKEIKEIVKKNREKFVGGLDMAVVAYEWKANEEEILVLAKEHRISFPSFDEDLKLGKINWIEEDFARLEGSKIELNFSAKKGNDYAKSMKVTVPVPKGEDFWNVGISINDGFAIKLHLKTGMDQTSSDSFKIF